MLLKSCLLLFLLSALQVSARYKSVELNFDEDEISSDLVAASSASSRIVSGWEAQPGEHPHHAALRFVNASGGIHTCGGSIISKDWIVTSALCTVTQKLAVVRAGAVSLINPQYVFETSEWYIHPQYNINLSFLQRNNIAVLKLQRPLVYTRFVKPIRIQSRADAFRDYDGQQVYASGHGRIATFGPESDVLRWVYLRAITNRACSAIWPGVFETTICARFYNVTSQNTCFGNRGGPLVHVGSDGVPTLIGVSYFFPDTGNGCHSGLPSGFVRPGAFLSWFEQVTGIDFENLQEDDGDVTKTTLEPTTKTSTTPTEDYLPVTTTPKPEDSEENEGEDLDSSESDQDDDMAQLLKRLEVDVNVKVRLSKFNVTKEVGSEISLLK